jgi:hypothetical protein
MVLGGRRRRIWSVLFDLMVCGWVLALAAPSVYDARVVDHRVPLFGVAMSAAVFFRRRWPLGVMAVVSALALLHLVLFGAPTRFPLTSRCSSPCTRW